MTPAQKCSLLLGTADTYLRDAQNVAPRSGTGRIQFERRILAVRGRVKELQDLLATVGNPVDNV